MIEKIKPEEIEVLADKIRQKGFYAGTEELMAATRRLREKQDEIIDRINKQEKDNVDKAHS